MSSEHRLGLGPSPELPPPPPPNEQASDEDIISQATAAAQAAAIRHAPDGGVVVTPAILIESYNRMFQEGMQAFTAGILDGVRVAVRSEVTASQETPSSSRSNAANVREEHEAERIVEPDHASLAPAESAFLLQVTSFNVTGLRANFNTIAQMAIECDVFCFQESFSEDFDIRPFPWPDTLFVAMTKAARDFRIGRGSGGVGVAIKQELLSEVPIIVYESASLMAMIAKFKSLAQKCLIFSVYKAPGTSPAFDGELLHRIVNAVERHPECSVLMMGDFNVNLGGWDGYAEEVLEDVFSCVPSSSLVNIPTSEGVELASTFASLGLVLRYISDTTGKALPTFHHSRKRADGTTVVGKSVIDFLFCDESLSSKFLRSGFSSEPESGHSAISFEFRFQDLALRSEGQPDEVWPPSEGTPVVSRVLNTQVIWDVSVSAEQHDYGVNGSTVTAGLRVIRDIIVSVTYEKTLGRKQLKFESHEAQQLRKTCRRLGRLMLRTGNTDRVVKLAVKRENYKAQWLNLRNQAYQDALDRSRQAFWEARVNGDLKRMWNLMKSQLGGKGGSIRPADTKWLTRAQWEDHFRSIMWSGRPERPLRVFTARSDVALDGDFTSEEVERALESKANHKATGPDGLPIDALRVFRYDEVVTAAVARLFSLIYASGSAPSDWHSSFLVVLKKPSGLLSDPNAYRGITLSSHLKKLFETCLAARLAQWCESNSMLPPEQAAFRKKSNTTEHIYALEYLQRFHKQHRKPLAVMLIDISKAFPSVPREALIRRLEDMGLSRKFLRILADFYSGDKYSVVLNGIAGDFFEADEGLQEGSVLSPPIFNLYFSPLVCHIRDVATASPAIGDIDFPIFQFADDVLLGATARGGMEASITGMEEFSAESNLRINSSKSELLILSSAGREDFSNIRVAGQAVLPSSSGRYLGIYFSVNGKWAVQFEQVIQRCHNAVARCKVMCIYFGETKIGDYVNLFDSVVSSIFRFGLGIWGWQAPHLMTKWDNMFSQFIRWAGRLPWTTSNKLILAELGRCCGYCDSIFLSACDIAPALISIRSSSPWARLVSAEFANEEGIFREIRCRFQDCGILHELLDDPARFLINRREIRGLVFHFCLRVHLMAETGSSSDDVRPFFSTARPDYLLRSRYVFSTIAMFRLNSWKRCSKLIRKFLDDDLLWCEGCDVPLLTPHVLAVCPVFAADRVRLFGSATVEFDTFYESDFTDAWGGLCEIILEYFSER